MPDDLNVGGVRDRGTIVALNAYWKDKQYAYDASGNMIYYGVHYLPNASTADGNWEVWKYTYGTDGITRIQGPVQGAWDNRATLAWS